MRSDPIADMLTRIRNASRAEHEKVDIPASKLKLRVAELLKDEGFIKNFRLLEDPKQGTLRVYLKYGGANERMISGLVRVSTPGRRVYVTRDRIPSSSAAWASRSCRRRGASLPTATRASRVWAGKSSPTCGEARCHASATSPS